MLDIRRDPPPANFRRLNDGEIRCRRPALGRPRSSQPRQSLRPRPQSTASGSQILRRRGSAPKEPKAVQPFSFPISIVECPVWHAYIDKVGAPASSPTQERGGRSTGLLLD